MIPKTLKSFIDAFSRLPALGPRAATRLAFFLVGQDRERLEELISALSGLRALGRCHRCFFLKEGPGALCAICTDRTRSQNIIAIVEKETDLLTLERTGTFRGTYLVLGELSEKGVVETSHKLRLHTLQSRIEKELGGMIDELVVAVNPTTLGDILYEMIREAFGAHAKAITRLGRGIPTGGEIEFADPETLKSALERRG